MGPLVYVDRSDIRLGKVNELEAGARRLVEHVASNERRALSYGVYSSRIRQQTAPSQPSNLEDR
jgi:hypothetical protein